MNALGLSYFMDKLSEPLGKKHGLKFITCYKESTMRTDALLITEIFYSLQGESSLSGIPFTFIRLTGCNLRCTYCDSSYAFKDGKMMPIPDILSAISNFKTRYVLVTGGEPLLQSQCVKLIEALNEAGYFVSIETHGEVSIEPVVKTAKIIMDIKTPGSGMSRGGFEQNLKLLKSTDEVKFVITSEQDYVWAKNIALSGRIPTKEILFSPVSVASGAPGSFEAMNPTWLANRILEDQLPVRFQIQLHKFLWGADRRGV